MIEAYKLIISEYKFPKENERTSIHLISDYSSLQEGTLGCCVENPKDFYC